MRHVGKPVAKIDALALVTGRPVYTSDLDLNDHALVVQLLRSPHASARIRAIDAAAARSLAGVACVLTHADVPATRSTLAGQPPGTKKPASAGCGFDGGRDGGAGRGNLHGRHRRELSVDAEGNPVGAIFPGSVVRPRCQCTERTRAA